MDINEFRKRQEADVQRRQQNDQVVRRRPFHERYAHLAQANQTGNYYDDDHDDDDDDAITSGSEADEEIQSPEAAGQQSAADEGEEA
jgi:hypothetical protein